MDWETLVRDLPKLEDVCGSDDVPLAVASATLGDVLTVVLVSPALLRTWVLEILNALYPSHL